MYSLFRKFFKKKEKNSNLVEVTTVSDENTTPKLTHQEEIELLEGRLLQKFREIFIEDIPVTLGEIKEDLERLWNLNHPNNHVGLMTKWQESSEVILQKDEEITKKILELVKKKAEAHRFDFQDSYISVKEYKERINILNFHILPYLEGTEYFRILVGSKLEEKYINFEYFEELELELLNHGYRFVRKDSDEGYLIYWKK